PFDWNGKKLAQRFERLHIRASIIEDTKHPGFADAAPARLVDEAGDRRHVQMTDDLREVILRIEAVVRHVFHLLDGVRVRVGPSTEDEPRFPRADLRAQLPRVLDASRPADAL